MLTCFSPFKERRTKRQQKLGKEGSRQVSKLIYILKMKASEVSTFLFFMSGSKVLFLFFFLDNLIVREGRFGHLMSHLENANMCN